MSDPENQQPPPIPAPHADPPSPPFSAPTASDRLLELEQARNQKSHGLVGLLVGAAFLAGGGLGYAGSSLVAPEPPKPAPVASAAPEPEPEPEPTFTERVAQGDFKAVEEVEAKPITERTAEEVIALTRGKRVTKRLALQSFAKQVTEDPDKALQDKDTLARLRGLFKDGQTTDYAADLLVSLPGHTAADLLYSIWTKPRKANETTEFAQALLYSKDFSEKVSPALRVALDLRSAEECEQFKEILPRAMEHGDRRSLGLVAKLNKRRGCGERKSDDCYECLRPPKGDKEALSVVDVIRKVRGRRAPKLD